MQVKRTTVPAKDRARLETLFEVTMRHKREAEQDVQVARRADSWVYEDVPEEDKCEVERIINTRVIANNRETLVKFVGVDQPEWLPHAEVTSSAPDAWAEFKKSTGKCTRSLRRPSATPVSALVP